MRPDYYKNNGVEAIHVSRYMHGCAAQAYQYVFRAGKKDDGVADCEKALTFLMEWKTYRLELADVTLTSLRYAEATHAQLLVGLPRLRADLLQLIFLAWAEGLDNDRLRKLQDGITSLQDFLQRHKMRNVSHA